MGKRGKQRATVTIVLMLALMAVSVGDSSGSRPGMDADLGVDDASFRGEDADASSQGTSDGQFMSEMAPVRTPYYFHTYGTEAPVTGSLTPIPFTYMDGTVEIMVTGPALPRILINNVGTFTTYVQQTRDNIPLTVFGVEHASIWASSDEGARDASFRITLLRNDADVFTMNTNLADLGSDPKELTVSDIPSLGDPIIFRQGDRMEVYVQYTAVSRVGAGPAPDCTFYANSQEYPSRVELDAIPMDLQVTVPRVGSDTIQVRGTVMDTCEFSSDYLVHYLEIRSHKNGPVDDNTIELTAIDDAWGEIRTYWVWNYRVADPIDDVYEFTISTSYGVKGIYYTNSTLLGLVFDESGTARIATEVDTDGDGYSDDMDAFPHDPTEWADSDGDGHGDNGDVFPGDGTEWNDTDGDGYGDNGDQFPDDSTEWRDSDGDGHGDNSDAFPNDSTEWSDSDGDGHGDNGDAFPNDTLEWLDTDDDGHGDNGDVFPDDALEWVDTDGDTHGDNGDEFLNDPLEWDDTDGDGRGDNGDAFPDDAAASVDTDGDGHPDEWNSGMTNEGSTTGLKLDHYPLNAEKWKEEESPALGGVFVLLAMLVGMAATMMRRKGKAIG